MSAYLHHLANLTKLANHAASSTPDAPAPAPVGSRTPDAPAPTPAAPAIRTVPGHPNGGPQPQLSGRPRRVRLSAKTASKPRTPQRSANAVKTPLGLDTRPALADLSLPGPRREREGRGGATASLPVLRCLIRTPLLPALTRIIPARTTGRPPAVPDLFYIFYLAALREYKSAEKLDQELREHWQVIRDEFWFTHDLLLPDAKPNGDIPNYDDFNKWRRRVVLNDDATVLDDLITGLTDVSLPLALAIRAAEGGDQPRPLHQPAIWDMLAADGTVMAPPSDVRMVAKRDASGKVVSSTIYGSRAASAATARVHASVIEKVNKRHGAKRGLFNVAAITRGVGLYTGVVLGVDIGHAHEGEDPVALRVLRRTYDRVGLAFPVLLYDGAMKPTYFQALLAEYGVYCVNMTAARPDGKANKGLSPAEMARVSVPGPRGPRILLGTKLRAYGTDQGKIQGSYVTPRDSVRHEVNGHRHQHHLVADGGAVFETDRPLTAGGEVHRDQQCLVPVEVTRLRDGDGEFYLKLTLEGPCEHGGTFTVTYDLRKETPGRAGLAMTSQIANLRVIPEACEEEFHQTYKYRNQVESFFAWLENRFPHKDRHASFGRPAQLLDLIGAALLHNTMAWAHLALRHPLQASQLQTWLDPAQAPRPAPGGDCAA